MWNSPSSLSLKVFLWKNSLVPKRHYLCLWLIPWKSITKSQNTFFLHVQNHVLWFFKTPGLDPARWSKDEGSCCEGLIPEVAKSSKALPKWAGFCLQWFEGMNDGLSLPSSWLPTPPTIEGSHSNHKNIKVLVDEAFESSSYSPQTIFDTLWDLNIVNFYVMWVLLEVTHYFNNKGCVTLQPCHSD
jgi:hypothetical protein